MRQAERSFLLLWDRLIAGRSYPGQPDPEPRQRALRHAITDPNAWSRLKPSRFHADMHRRQQAAHECQRMAANRDGEGSIAT
jgi:hypothetical protein